VSTGVSSPRAGQDGGQWTIRSLIAGHRLAASGVAAACALVIGLFVLTALGAKAGTVTDSTSCTQWGSVDQNLQTAYARLYVSEHGAVPRWGASPAMVINAINAGCFEAYGDDVSDTTSVVQAISGNF
jgi:hypothetical protein